MTMPTRWGEIAQIYVSKKTKALAKSEKQLIGAE
jgi:hypothetical protein